jgi:hypothetical protein
MKAAALRVLGEQVLHLLPAPSTEGFAYPDVIEVALVAKAQIKAHAPTVVDTILTQTWINKLKRLAKAI